MKFSMSLGPVEVQKQSMCPISEPINTNLLLLVISGFSRHYSSCLFVHVGPLSHFRKRHAKKFSTFYWLDSKSISAPVGKSEKIKEGCLNEVWNGKTISTSYAHFKVNINRYMHENAHKLSFAIWTNYSQQLYSLDNLITANMYAWLKYHQLSSSDRSRVHNAI